MVRFIDDETDADAAALNSLDRGGLVYQSPAGGLLVNITSMRWLKHSSVTVFDYAGASDQAVADNATNYVYLTNANVLTINTTGFPAAGTGHIPLATVVCAGAVITGINEKRIAASIP